MANGPTRLWMVLALGSVLIVGLSAGLLADRSWLSARSVEVEKAAPEKTRGAHPPTFHFDCPDPEATPAAATRERRFAGASGRGAFRGIPEAPIEDDPSHGAAS